MTQADPEAILRFWFGDAATPAPDRDRFWFGGGEAVDDLIRARFATLPARARQGEFDAWREQPRPTLALVLVLDQFPRSIYRGTADSFAFDADALSVSVAAIESGVDRKLEPVEAVFLYMPLEHSEDIAIQTRCVALFRELVERVPGHLKERMKGYESYAIRHYEVIDRFGRFPHRNAVLGRPTTAEERLYLESGGDTF